MKKFVALCTISVFALSTQAFADGHSAASGQGIESSGGQATSTPGGLANGIEKSGGKAGNATKKPGKNK